MIPYWRYVRYTDDGCALYQCLSCYNEWEGRGAPGWTDMEGQYHTDWKFCPCCGVEWFGCNREREEDYGPRRTRIRQAQDARREELWRVRYEDLPCNQADYWWVIEERSTCLLYDHTEGWIPRYKAKGGIVPVKKVLEHARSWQ
jgi:hypothetical protein